MKLAKALVLISASLVLTTSAVPDRKQRENAKTTSSNVVLKWFKNLANKLRVAGHSFMRENSARNQKEGLLKKTKKFYQLSDKGSMDHRTKYYLKRLSCSTRSINGRESLRWKRYTRLGKAVWEKLPVTISFQNYYLNISIEEQEDVVMGCAMKWGNVSNLQFQLLRNTSTNILIGFGSLSNTTQISRVGFGLSPTPWANPTKPNLRIESRINWKPRKSSPGPDSVMSLEEIICHEMGHTLGLGHSTDKAAIMYPLIGFRSVDTQLGLDDTQGIQSLYGENAGQGCWGIPIPMIRFTGQVQKEQN